MCVSSLGECVGTDFAVFQVSEHEYVDAEQEQYEQPDIEIQIKVKVKTRNEDESCFYLLKKYSLSHMNNL
jgi:hypothetical protein